MKEVVHVPTRELAEEVLRVAQKNGLMTAIVLQYWEYYNKNTYFRLSEKGRYGSIVFSKENNDTIITAQEFLSRYKESELDQLRKENEELRKQLKAIEDQPKVGDVCLFWDGDMNSYLVSVLKNVKLGTEYPYENENGLSYNYCIKATDENIQAKIKELQDEN